MSADDKAAAAWGDYIDQQQEEKIEELERQLNAANAKIKRLEEAGQRVDDAAHSIQDWSGTVLGDALDELNKAKEDKP